jgi:hypothetical protein
VTASKNLDLGRSIYAAWERGDFSAAEWAHPEIEYVVLRAAGFPPSSTKGRTAMRETARANIGAWAQLRIAAEEYRELDSERVLVLDDVSGRGKAMAECSLEATSSSCHHSPLGHWIRRCRSRTRRNS